MFDVAVIGAGASGVLTAVHIGRVSSSTRVALLDAGARAARGLAYGTPYGAHLLNVPASRMSALATEPDHFLNWLQAHLPGATGSTFAPRPLYGDYLSTVLADAMAEESGLTRIAGSAVGLTRDDDAWTIHLHDGRTVVARTIVLALGNLPPGDPVPAQDVQPLNYIRDPWSPGVGQGLGENEPVLMIGSGLTMVDIALVLRAQGHRGTIHVLSRRGQLPRAHAAYLPRPIAPPETFGSPRSVIRWLRGEVRCVVAEGGDWRSIIDGLRPHTQTIWRAWSETQRASFLRHARTMWDVHRHRCAPEVAAEIDKLLRSGVLVVHRGRIRSLIDDANGISARWTAPDGTTIDLTVARAINCTGPASNYARVDLPLVVNMRRAGWLVPDALGLGVETDADGQMIGSDGQPVAGLFTIGPLRRAALWESTAIPEIRAQAAALAARLADASAPSSRSEERAL